MWHVACGMRGGGADRDVCRWDAMQCDAMAADDGARACALRGSVYGDETKGTDGPGATRGRRPGMPVGEWGCVLRGFWGGCYLRSSASSTCFCRPPLRLASSRVARRALDAWCYAFYLRLRGRAFVVRRFVVRRASSPSPCKVRACGMDARVGNMLNMGVPSAGRQRLAPRRRRAP